MSAFTSIVFAQGFENVTIRKIVESADIARSTFYEHFSNKEDVLRACMGKFFSIIADCIVHDDQPAELGKVLDHLWSNRRLTDAIFSGHARDVLARNQVDLVEQRLRAMNPPTIMPPRLSAIPIAEAQLALVESWMRGRAFCPREQLALGLHRSSRASALALSA
jgi:AcrR family transcriptional regulator